MQSKSAVPFWVPESGTQNCFKTGQFYTPKMSKRFFFGPKSGPTNGSAFLVPKNKNHAHAMWQWYNFCAARIPPGNAPLHINVDETSVFLFQEREEGGNRFPEAKEPMCVPGAFGRTKYLHLPETLRWRSVVCGKASRQQHRSFMKAGVFHFLRESRPPPALFVPFHFLVFSSHRLLDFWL